MRIKITFLSVFISFFSFSQTKGTLSGTITDKEANNAALPFVNVLVKNTTIAVTTDDKGVFSFTINPGNYTLVLSFVGYENLEVPVVVKAGETTMVNKSLGNTNNTLKDVVIKQKTVNREKETALLLDQKKAVEIKQSIGAQEMSRKGVSDVEEGLTKITGITKVDGRGLFIRGLEDRYNNLLVNDLQVPSNVPFKKIIPLDIFPTDIVGVLNIYKTFNPNISGDFAGATVNIETAQARGKVTKLSVGYGYTTGNNGNDFLISSDANTTQGFLGLIKKDRELPATFGKIPSAVKLTPSQYKDDYKNNSWNVDQTSSPINSSISFLHTDKYQFKNNTSFSYILSLNADNKYTIRKGIDRTFNQGQGNYDNNFEKSQYNYLTSISALLGLKYKANRYSLAFNSFYLRTTENRIQDQIGSTNGQPLNDKVVIRLNQYEQSDFLTNQLLGDFKITEDGKHTIKAGGSYIKTAFQQPDRKFIVGTKVGEDQILAQNGGNHLGRQYLDVKGNFYVSSLLEYNLNFSENENGKSNKLSVGYNSFRNNLSSTYRFFSGKPIFVSSYTTSINNINTQVLDDVNNGIIRFSEESNADYKIKFNQFVNSGYVNLYWNFGKKIEANAGVRLENSKRDLKYRLISKSFDDPYTNDVADKLSFLPSVNLKYLLNEKNNIRFAASKTITRPVTMELLPNQYVNADGTVEVGNKDLEDSQNLNLDLKYELFPNNKELFVVGLFSKNIKNPIERIFIPTASSGGQITTYQSSKQALIYGAEFEFLLQMSRINKSLSNFSFGLNASLMSTKVDVDLAQNPLENNPTRKLQGASDWLLNSDLKYDFEFNEIMKNSITLVYGVFGDRIYAVGTANTDNVYEKSFHKLDMVWSSKLSKNIDLKFSVDNLLNPNYKQELGPNSKITIDEPSLLLKQYKRGVGYALNVSYTF